MMMRMTRGWTRCRSVSSSSITATEAIVTTLRKVCALMNDSFLGMFVLLFCFSDVIDSNKESGNENGEKMMKKRREKKRKKRNLIYKYIIVMIKSNKLTGRIRSHPARTVD